MPSQFETANRRTVVRRRTGWALALLASTALVAVPPALAPLGMSSTAWAKGGASGSQTNGGDDNVLDVGANGQAGSGGGAGLKGGTGGTGPGTGSGMGGLGGLSLGADGAAGVDASEATGGGGGGGGGAHGGVSANGPISAVAGGKGGDGGNGGATGPGGGGGAGGYGYVYTGVDPLQITSDITGGEGGKGGTGKYTSGILDPGAGGTGGAGLILLNQGVAVTVGDNVTISGGMAGVSGSGTAQGTAGGIGIKGSQATLTLSSSATVAGGKGQASWIYSNAISLIGGGNTLNLNGNGATSGSTYATLTGAVDAAGGNNTLGLTGLGGVFDLSSLDSQEGSTEGQFHGFGSVKIDASGTWVVTKFRPGDADTTWEVAHGTLQLGAPRETATLYGNVTVDTGGTLSTSTTLSNDQSMAVVNGDVTVASGGTLSVVQPDQTGSHSLTVNNLVLNSGSTLKYRLERITSASLVVVSGQVTYNGAPVIIERGRYLYEGTYPLVSYATAASDTDAPGSLTVPADFTGALTNDKKKKLLSVTLTAADLYWNGTTTSGSTGPIVGGSGEWTSDSTTTNWTGQAGTDRFGFNGKGAIFAGTAGTVTVGSDPAVSATGLTFKTTGYVITGSTLDLQPKSGQTPITVDGSDVTATISSELTSTSGVEILGGGTLVLTADNTYTGGTTITSGTLQIGDGGTKGSISGPIKNNAKLVFDRSNDVTFADQISGTGSLEKKGAGTLTLTATTDATKMYTGETKVNAGMLVFAGAGRKDSVIPGAVTVASGATLSAVPSLIAGNQSLTVADLTFLTGSTLKVKLGAPSSVALIKSTGTFAYNGNLTVASDSSLAEGTYALITYTGQIGSGSSATGMLTGPSGYTLSTSIDEANHVLLLSVSAPDPYWNGTTTTGNKGPVVGGDGTWTSDATSTNWTSEDGTSRVAAASGKAAYFAGTGGTVTVDGKGGQSPVSAAGLVFKVDGYKIVGDVLTLSPSSGTAKVTVDGSGLTATIGSALATTKGMELLGGGTLVLTGENTYTGGTTITSGTLQVGDGGTKGSISGPITNNAKLVFNRSNDVTFGGLIDGSGSLEKKGAGTLTLTGLAAPGLAYSGATTVSEGTLAIKGSNLDEASKLRSAVTVAAGATLAIKTGTETNSLDGAGSVVIDSNATLSLVASSSSTTFSGVISGGGALSKQGTGTLTLSGANTIGSLSVGPGTVVLSGGTTVAGNMGFRAGGTLELVNQGATVGRLTSNFGDGTIKLNDQTLVINGDTFSSYSGTIEGTGGLTMSGSSRQTLSGTGTFTGPVLVNNGTLELKGGAALASTAAVTVATTGTLSLADDAQAIGALSGNGTVKESSASGGTVALSVGNANTNTTFSGSLIDGTTGRLALIKIGTGTLTLTGSNSYTGGTTISGGTLQIGDGTTTGGISGDITNNGSLVVNRSDALSYAGVVSGSGTLVKAGGGTLTITGANTFTGTTTVAGGTLQVSGGGALAGAVTVQDGATLAGDSTSVSPGIVNTLTVLSGGTLKAITGQTTLAVGSSLTMKETAHVALGLGAPSETAAVSVGGDLKLFGTLDIAAGTDAASGTYRVFDYAGQLTGPGLTIGDAPDDSLFGLDTTTSHQVNLKVAAGQYWNGGTTSSGGTAVTGGTGTWDATTTNWTDRTGHDAKTLPQGALTIFAGTPGTVTLSDGTAPEVAAMSFRKDGYEITGGTIALVGFNGSATTRISVQDDSVQSGGIATIGSMLTGSQTIDKTGRGTLILTAQSVGFTGNVNVSAGTIIATNDRAVGQSGSVNVAKGATFILKAGNMMGRVSGQGSIVLDGGSVTMGTDDTDSTLEAILSGSGSLTKTGAGTLTVASQNTYTGMTTVDDGELDILGEGRIAGDVTVQGKGRLTGASGSSVDGTVHVLDGGTLSGGPTKGLSMGSLEMSDKGKLAVTLGGPNSASVFEVKNDVTLAGTLAVSADPSFGLGVYRIADYGGKLTDRGMGVQGLSSSLVGGVQTSIDKQVNLIVESADAPELSFWNGSSDAATQTVKGGPGTWSNRSSQTNWINDSGTIPRASSNNFKVFQGQAGDVTVDTSAGAVSASGLQFVSDGYVLKGDAVTLSASGPAKVRVGDGTAAGTSTQATIASDLLGTGGLEKTDFGTLTFVGTKTYGGGTTISAGTLKLGDGTSSGSVTGDIVNDASLVFSPGSAQGFAGAISGTGSLTKVGAGTLSLTGASSYTGATTVAAGRLDVDGSLSSTSGVVVQSGATLGGSGSVGSAVQVAAGGTLAGVQGQTLTTGNLTLSPGSHVSAQLGATAGTPALFSVKGDLALNGVLDVANPTGRFGTGLYRLFSYTGALSGSGLSVSTLSQDANVPDLAVQTDAGAKTVNLITKPTEASFWNGGKPGAGIVQGGDGTWTSDTIWTNATATNSAGIQQEATAIFTGTPGTVRVDASKGPVSVAGMQFASSGYTVSGDALTLRPTGTTVRVGDGTKESASTTATIAAPVTGSGSLHKTDYGTLVLSGENTYSGGTSVEAGVLKLVASGAAGSGAVSLNEGTTLAFGGDLTLANALSFPQVGDPIIDTGDHQVTIAGAIDGVGDLSKAGSGTLVLTGLSTYTGATDVTSGTLVVDGSIATSLGVKVQSGATLGGSGSVPGVTVLSGGSVAPGAATPFATLNVSGSVSFAAGSTYQVQIDGSGRTDRIAATGSATLSGGTVDVRAGTGTYSPGLSYRILSAAKGVTGRFESLRATTNLAFLQPSLAYDSTSVSLGFTRTTTGEPGSGGTGNGSTGGGSSGGSASGAGGSAGSGSSSGGATGGGAAGASRGTGSGSTGNDGAGSGQSVVTFASVAATANQRAAASAVEALGSGRLYQGVLSQSAAGARQAFDSVSGEIHASAVSAAVEDSRVVREAILNRLQGAGAAGTAAPLGAQFGPAVWGTGFGTFGRNGGDSNAARLKRAVGGFVLGADARLDVPGLEGWRIGVAGGYTDDAISVNARSSRGDLKTVFGGAYAGALYGSLDVKLGILGGGTQVTTQRTVLFPGFMDTTRARRDGTLVQGFGEMGYRIGIAGGYVEPLLQGAAIHLNENGIQETGGPAALQVLRRGTAVGTTTAGLRSELTLSSDWPLTMRSFVGWRHAFGDVSPKSLVAFGGSGSVFAVSGAPIDQDAVVAEIGLTYRASEAVSLGVSYSAQAGRRASDQGVKGQLDVRF